MTRPDSDRPLKLRLLLWLYGTANLAGCACALLGPILLITGVIEHGWLPITAGLYGAGALLFLRSPELDRRIEDTLTVEQTLDHLDAVIRTARPHLNDTMSQRLGELRDSVAEVLPRLLASGRPGDDLFVVRETVLRYLPETLANYVALPPAFRATRALQAGRTARDLLAEQLDLLAQKMREVVANVASGDAQALVANGQFLQSRFRQPDFLVS